MYGLEAISAANGWSMALAGALIVLSGLTVLSFVISQLHNLIALFQKRDSGETEIAELSSVAVDEPMRIDDRDLMQIEAATTAYGELIDQLDQPFALKALYARAKEKNYPHVHLTIRSLREARRISPRGEGLFEWTPAGASVIDEPPPQAAVPTADQTISTAPSPMVSEPAAPPPASAAQPSSAFDGEAVAAPMPGMIVRYVKKVGETVTAGETVVVLEAMKMENALSSPVNGEIREIRFASGDAVAKGDILCVIN